MAGRLLLAWSWCLASVMRAAMDLSMILWASLWWRMVLTSVLSQVWARLL